MKLTSLLVTAALATCVASAAYAQYPMNGYIGLYADAAGTNCCITAPPGPPTNTHVIAKLEGGTAGGITQAEFRIEIAQENGTAPTGWLFIWTPNPGNSVALGNPMDEAPQDAMNNSGANVAFATCQPEPLSGQLAIGTLGILNFGAGTPFIARTKQKTPPSNPALGDCPLMVLCDAPVFTALCTTIQTQNNMGVEGIGFVAKVNLPCTPNPCGPVATEETTWSTMKGLFR